MNEQTIDSLWSYPYEESFLEDVHRLLFAGHQRARSQIHAGSEEDDITGFLAQALEIEVENPLYLGRYSVQEQKPVHHAQRAGKRRQKIDLIFRSNDPSQKREFCCEAKRLKTGTNTISDYTGVEGMGCFVNCEYAADQPVGAMLGYVQSSTMNYWHRELTRSLGATAAVNIQTPLSNLVVIPELPHEWSSTHWRTSGEDILIYHIFLDCQ